MKRKSNNSGRQVRSQEEIEARREARRKYYEEMEAFERDLPDFIFADEQTDSREELTEEFDANTHNNIEENENHEDFGSGKASGAVFASAGKRQKRAADETLEESRQEQAADGIFTGSRQEQTAGRIFTEPRYAATQQTEEEDEDIPRRPRKAVVQSEEISKQLTAMMDTDAVQEAVRASRTKAAKKSSRMEEKKADTILYQTEDMVDFDEAEITEDAAAEAAPVKKKKASAKSGRKSVSDKSGTGKADRKKSGQLKSVSSKSATGKKKKSSGKRTSSSRKHRRRRKNWKPAVIAASLAVVVLGGGGFGLHALGIIGGRELYGVYVNNTLVGKVEDPSTGRDTYLQVRREVVSNADSMVLMEADCDIRKVETLVKLPSKEEDLQNNMKQALEDTIVGTVDKAYTVKINDYIVNLQDKNEVVELLDAVKSPYDTDNQYSVQLVADTSKELTSLTTQIVKTEESSDIAGVASADDGQAQELLAAAGEGEDAGAEEEAAADTENLPESTGEGDGLKNLAFVENIEIAESYVSADSISTLEQAIEDVTKEKEENQTYEVTSGDCLSVVAEKNDMTVAKLLEINPDLDKDTVLQIGDKITVTTPEPELSVVTQEEVSYEEDYEEPVQYVDNDSWYTTKEVVTQEASTGHRKVTALVTYKNGNETGREIIAQTIVTEAKPKIIERGTQAPPTYIKPISGGRYSSGFGKRWGRMHKGVDWACSVGTAVKASCGGTVVSAGWSNGYGYCITIRHPDGKQTRYAHLSKILVSSGKSVKQGDKIALSGNTGRSTGPHIHFEILVNGSQVNPLKYLN